MGLTLGANRPPSAADADAADVERARSGDEVAFEALVTRHERALFNLALRMLGSRDDAVEAVQETFLRVFRSLSAFRGQAAFRTWIYGITLNVCRNRLASASRARDRRTVPLVVGEDADPAELPLPDPSPGPEASAYGGELREALGKALLELSAEHREVILLREAHGMDHQEIAAALGCAVGTVKSRLARARAALRGALEGTWP